MPRPLLLAVVWLVGVALAIGTGLLAVRLVGDQVGDAPQSVLSQADLREAAAQTPTSRTAAPVATTTQPVRSPSVAPTAAPSRRARPPIAPTSRPTGAVTREPTRPPSPGPTRGPVTSAPRTFSITGGTLSVRCAGTAGQLVYAAPAPGWGLDEQSVSGPQVEVRFASADTRSRITVTCVTGTPVEKERRVDGDSGSGNG